MSETDEKRTSDFLKYAIDRLESGIALVDNKASILIAVIAGLAAALTFMCDKALWTESAHPVITTASYYVFALIVLPLPYVVFLLLWSIRPDKRALKTKSELAVPDKGFFSLLWPDRDFYMDWEEDPKQEKHPNEKKHPEQKVQYDKSMKELCRTDRSAFEHKDLKHTHFALFQLMPRKYHHYRRAILVLRWWVLVVGLLILMTIASLVLRKHATPQRQKQPDQHREVAMFVEAKRVSDDNPAAVNLDCVEVLRAAGKGCRLTADGDEYEIDTPVEEVLRLAKALYIRVGNTKTPNKVERWGQAEQ